MNAALPALQVGDWLDVIDSDGIWNVAQVLKLPTRETVEITYDCWGDKYNEELRRDSDRIAPFHTHTWAVKCWAKLPTWPWWPALLTVRAPGSDRGAHNLRLEESLLVDFLDKAAFPNRFRCWVKKSKIVAFQSDKITRLRLAKLKMKNGIKADARSKNLTFAMALLAKCDAQEAFPDFVEGTLPVKYKHSYTRPLEEVRKEMGEEVWARGFVDNRVNHAATHAYTPVLAEEGEPDSRNGVELSNSVETADASATGTCDTSQKQEKDTFVSNAGTVSTWKQYTNVSSGPVKNTTVTQMPNNARKRARPNVKDDVLDNTNSSLAEKATLFCKQAPECRPKQYQDFDFDGECREANSDEKVLKRSTVTIEPRRYGKTPKKLKTVRKSASKLPPYIPPYARLLPTVEPRDEDLTSHARHATQPRTRVEKGNVLVDAVLTSSIQAPPLSSLQPGVPGKALPADDRDVQQSDAAMRRESSCESKPGDKSVSPMKSLARLTHATLRADERMRNMKTALEGKLTELTQKAAKAEEIRNKCAALSIRVHSHPFVSQQEYRGDSQARSLMLDAASETQSVIQNDLPLGSSSHEALDASGVPTLVRRSSQPRYTTRRLELALDDAISKQRYQNLNAATTSAELDAIKAELLRSPEVQAAIIRMGHPSYRWAAPTGVSYRGSSSLSNVNSGCALETVKKPIIGQSARRLLSERSSSQHLGLPWGYNRESEEGDSKGSRGLSTCSMLLGPPPTYSNTFGFSVHDNFSMNQWYRDLYPRSFGFQQPW